MLFSVLIPVYNTSKYLDECIQSVLSQTENDYEIVLIDDGSTDNSDEICDYYAKEYSFIRVIHKQNEGLMMTRRRGFQEAKGEYFICLDSDDYLCDNEVFSKIKKMIIEKDCDLVLYNYLMEKETRDKDQHITLFDKPDEYVFSKDEKLKIFEKLLIGGFLNPLVIKVPHRSIVDVDTDYSIWADSLYKSQGEDLFQSLPILDKASNIGYLNQIFYHYRWNGEGISKQLQIQYYYSYKTIYSRTDEFIGKWSLPDEDIHRIKVGRVKMISSIIVYCYNHSDNRQEWLQFVDSLANDSFFIGLYDVENKSDILLYYRMVGFFIRHRMKLSLQLCIKTVSFLSGRKNKLKG